MINFLKGLSVFDYLIAGILIAGVAFMIITW